MADDLTQELRKKREREASWRDWFRMVYPGVFYAVYRMTGGDVALSEDLTQTAIERFLRYGALDKVATDREAVAYLISTARRLNADLARRGAARQAAHQAVGAARSEDESNAGDDELEAFSLNRLTDRLSSEERELIRWWCEGRSVRDIASSLGTARHTPAAQEWLEGLNVLRNTMVHESFARIAMGGGIDQGGGMPSLAQDVLVSLRNKRPLYILGGFGDCAHGVAAALHLMDTPSSAPGWQGVDEFDSYSSADLHNGLDVSENQTLANTDDVEEAMGLVLRGLGRVAA